MSLDITLSKKKPYLSGGEKPRMGRTLSQVYINVSKKNLLVNKLKI